MLAWCEWACAGRLVAGGGVCTMVRRGPEGRQCTSCISLSLFPLPHTRARTPAVPMRSCTDRGLCDCHVRAAGVHERNLPVLTFPCCGGFVRARIASLCYAAAAGDGQWAGGSNNLSLRMFASMPFGCLPACSPGACQHGDGCVPLFPPLVLLTITFPD